MLERNKAEENLIKLKNKLQAILQKYEAEAHENHSTFETQCITLTPEARLRDSELEGSRLLLRGK